MKRSFSEYVALALIYVTVILIQAVTWIGGIIVGGLLLVAMFFAILLVWSEVGWWIFLYFFAVATIMGWVVHNARPAYMLERDSYEKMFNDRNP